MKVGLFLPQFEHWMAGDTAGWDDLVSMATTAEEHGFDSLWLADHLWLEVFPPFDALVPGEPPHGAWESWTLLSALAARTSRVELGTLVTSMRFRNPAFFAKIIDVIEEVSGGRTIVGLGAGGPNLEYRAFGFPRDKYVSRFAESIELFHRLIRTGEADFEGKYYQAEQCRLRPRGPRPQGPPILVGCQGDRMLRLTARFADLWNFAWVHELDSVRRWRDRVDAACEAEGRDPATLGRTVSMMIDLPGARDEPDAKWVRAWRETSKPVAGTEQQIADHLHTYEEAGISHVQVWLSPNTRSGVEAFAGVLDRLRQA